jgi:hypothetical protein
LTVALFLTLAWYAGVGWVHQIVLAATDSFEAALFAALVVTFGFILAGVSLTLGTAWRTST